MAQAFRPSSTKRRSCDCSMTGSGVVSPVATRALAALPGAGGRPMPSVPTTAQGFSQNESSCATHQAVEVLPLVPVMATMSSAALGAPWKALAIAPANTLRPGTATTRSSSKA